MRKKEDEFRDIYQAENQDLDKDFTPQVPARLLESRLRDARFNRIAIVFFGLVIIAFMVGLTTLAIRTFLGGSKPYRDSRLEKSADVLRLTQSTALFDVLEYQPDPAIDKTAPGEKPFSAPWIKIAAHHAVTGQREQSVGRTKETIEEYKQIIEAYPKMIGVYRAIGQLHLQLKEYAEAVPYLEKALEEDESFDSVRELGEALNGAEQYEQAEKILKKALEMHPEAPVCHKNLAMLYKNLNREKDAIFYFEKYIDLQPKDLDTRQTYALYLMKLGRWADTVDLLTKLSTEVTDVVPIYFLLAQAQIQTGQTNLAVAALQNGAQLMEPSQALIWVRRDEFSALRNSAEFKSLTNKLGQVEDSPL